MAQALKTRRPLRLALIVLLAAALLLAGGLALVCSYFYHLALDPSAEHFFGGTPQPLSPSPSTTWFQSGQTVRIESEDGLSLNAYQFFDQPGHRYLISCHGYGGQASYMAKKTYPFYQMGFQVLMPDARGFGESEGSYAGMGWHERRDVVGWCNYILDQDPQAEIVLFGVSMGAATVMMASGEADLPQAVKAVIEDCGYTSVWDEFAYQLDALFGLPTFPILDATSLFTQWKDGWNFKEASALEQVKKCTVPTLFIHGDADDFVPFEMVQPLYDGASCPKELLVIPGAGHGACAETDPETYWNTVTDFLAAYLPA